MLSGGSVVSWSVTFAAKTVTEQVSFGAKFVSGSSVNVVGPPPTVAVCPSLVLQAIEYQPSAADTGSENVTEMFESTATLLEPLAGDVEVTDGAVSAGHLANGVKKFRGFGEPTEKSAELLSVSAQPPELRSAAVVLERVGVGVVSNMFAPS